MANRTELIRGLAEIFNRTELSVQCQDRTLATAGVRENSRRGRGGPPVTSTDIMQLATALVSNKTFRGASEFVRTRSELILIEVSIEEDDRKFINKLATSDPRRFGEEFSDLIETAPQRPDLVDMEVRVSRNRPEAFIRISEGEKVSVFTFRDKPDPDPSPSYEEYVTLPRGVMSRLVGIRHGAFEMPFNHVPDIKNDHDMVGPEGLEPPT